MNFWESLRVASIRQVNHSPHCWSHIRRPATVKIQVSGRWVDVPWTGEPYFTCTCDHPKADTRESLETWARKARR